MGELTKEIVKNAILGENSRANEVLHDLYFNDLSLLFLVKGIKGSKYYYISKDLVNIKNNAQRQRFSLKERDLHPYTVEVLKKNKEIEDIFDYDTLDEIKISSLLDVVNSYNYYIEAVMIARIIEREERIMLVTTMFAIFLPLAALVLGIITLILTVSKANQ